MVVDAKDPVTDTKWIDWDNPIGSLMTMAGGVLGVGALLFVIGVASNTVEPFMSDIASSVSGGRVQGQSSGIGFKGEL